MKTSKKRKELIGMILSLMIFLILNLSLIFGAVVNTYGDYKVYGSSVNPQFTDPSYSSNLGVYGSYVGSSYAFDGSQCAVGGDILMQIIPGSCSPPVVRSDLLEEQNVPVFCKVRSLQLNPLVDVSNIKSLHFTGEYPKGVSGVSYFPAKAGVKKTNINNGLDIVESPINDDLGYLVIVVSRQALEKDMPDYVEGNITATIDYEKQGSFGIGEGNYYITEVSDDEWQRSYRENGFWNGRGYIRADSIYSDSAVISVYRDIDTRQSVVTLKKGETSKDIYLGGYYCSGGLKVKLEDLRVPVDSALLQINDKQTWVSKGDTFLDGKCKVIDLQISGGGGKLSVSCSVSNGKFDLSLNPGSADFTLGTGESKKLSINSQIDSKKYVYLAYVGQDSANEKYAVVIEDGFSKSEGAFADKEIQPVIDKIVQNNNKKIQELTTEIEKAVKLQYTKKLTKEKSKEIDTLVKIKILKEKESYSDIKLNSVFAVVDKNWDAEGISEEDKLAKSYYDLAIEKYQDLFDFYPSEKASEQDAYATIGLFEAAQLSKQFGMNAKAMEFYDRIIIEYPDSDMARSAKINKELLTKYDNSNSKALLNINNEKFFIDLLDFKQPKKSEASAVFLIDGEEKILGLNQAEKIGNNEALKQIIELKELDNNVITIEYKKEEAGKEVLSTQKMNLNNNINLDGVQVKLIAINLKKQAKVSILPADYGTRTQAKFSFRIGIEKRAIQLSPEKAKEMADNLIKTINTLNDINYQLGNVIKVMKTACYATSALLTAKNMFSGLDGSSIARNDLMTKAGGWNEKCEKLVNEGKYKSLQQCFLDKKNGIENDVNIYSQEIQKTNNILKGIQNEVGIKTSDSLDLQGQVDSKQVEDKFKVKFNDWCKTQDGSITLPDKVETKVSFNGENGICSWDSLTHEQRREIMTLQNIKGSGSEVLKDVTNRQLGIMVLNGKNYQDNSDSIKNPNEEENYKSLGIRTTYPIGDSITYGDIKTISSSDKGHSIYGNFEKGRNVMRVFIPVKKTFGDKGEFVADSEVAGKEVIVEVSNIEGSGGEYKPEGKIYLVSSGKEVGAKASESVKQYMSLAGMNRIKQTDATNYNNPLKNADRLQVKYFERAPYKGLPSEVPFDIKNGWYVETTYVLSGFGKPYDDSGRVLNFYICNAGPNGLIEFKKSADDICRYYNDVTGASLDFPGLSSADSKKLVSQAQRAIQDAASQYGKEKVTINGNSFKTGTSFGGESGQCTDFMSPEDCNILFNVCDPVICPASRCDLGGDFRVDNVIQTGIIGSLVLCLPNAREGVMVPICLTGVHAGLEGYISILNSTVECLNESINTGRNIGICDEIKSIYVCEFFWKQAGPFLEVLMPRLLGGFYGQVRGGGEYTSVDSAWRNTQAAINYFQNDYAVNSMRAFQDRSTSEIGTDFCKLFVSQTVPGSTGFFNALIEPDSPVQYHAWFSENQMTSATILPVSHYKVYFHIYAGNDIGASYSVYLRDLPSLSGIRSFGYYTVDSGYVPRGGQVDRARDFTATSGFKQLCVSVNGREECGFGQVSTSYVLDRLSDEYIQEQMQSNIVSERECIAGTPSALSLINPNLQAGIEQGLNPELYNKGIIRVCSTDNPEKQTTSEKYDTTNSSYSRWKEVGYCDDRTIKCWLDTNSVKDVVRDKGIENQILSQTSSISNILNELNYLTISESSSLTNKIDNSIKNLVINKGEGEISINSKIKDIIIDLNKLIESGTNNVYRARGLYMFGKLYKKIASNLLGVETKNTLVVEKVAESPVKTEIVSENNVGESNKADENVKTETTTKTSEPEKINWKDDMLKENVNIVLVSTFGKHITYKYRDSRWVASDDDVFVDESKEKDWSYVEGINQLVIKTDFTEEMIIGNEIIRNTIADSDEQMAEKVFEKLKK